MVRQRTLVSCLVASLLSPFFAQAAQPANPDKPEDRCEKPFVPEHKLDWELQNKPLVNLTTSSESIIDFEVVCKDCRSWGTIRPSFHNQDPENSLIEIDFNGVGAHFDFALKSSGPATQAIQLLPATPPSYRSNKPHGARFWVYLDLVLRVTTAIDFDGGFHLSVADQSSLTIDINDEDIQDVDFKKGTKHQSIPITVHSGGAIFTADLRIRVHSEIWKHKDDAAKKSKSVAGAYINIVEFTSDLTGNSDTCPPNEKWNINAGAYAGDSEGESKVIVPAESTIFYSATFVPDCAVPSTTSPAGHATGTTSEGWHASTTSSTKDTSTAVTTSVEQLTTTPTMQQTTISSEASSKTTAITIDTTLVRRGIAMRHRYSNRTTTVITSCLVPVVNCPTEYTTKITVTATDPRVSSSASLPTTGSAHPLWKRQESKPTPTMTDGLEFTSLESPIVLTFSDPAATSWVHGTGTTTMTTTISSTVTIMSVSTATMTISTSESTHGVTTNETKSFTTSTSTAVVTTSETRSVTTSTSTPGVNTSETKSFTTSVSSVQPAPPNNMTSSTSSVGTDHWKPTSAHGTVSGGELCSKSAPSHPKGTGASEPTPNLSYVMPREPTRIIVFPNAGSKMEFGGRSGFVLVIFCLGVVILF